MNNSNDFQFDRPPLVPSPRARSNMWLVVACVCVAVGGALAIVGRELVRGGATNEQVRPAEKTNPLLVTTPPEKSTATVADAKSPADANLIDDDGRSMWASPTLGKPLDWAYLPPGVQIVLALRPAALAAHPEGDKLLASLGPLGTAGIHSMEEQTGVPFRELERLVIGWQLTGDKGELAATLVVYARADAPHQEAFESKLPDAKQQDHGGHAYWQVGARAYYRPASPGGPSLVVSPADAMEDIIDLGGKSPPLRRDVERLTTQTDSDRHVTLIVAPGVLFGEGRDMFAGELSRLRRPLFWFLNDELSAAALSLHWDENFFMEAVATSTLDVPATRAAQQLADRVAQMPDQIEAYTVELNASPYSRRVVARLPAMIRKLATYTRSGFGRDYVVLRCYLPAIAGHNLLMASELALAEPPGKAQTVANPPVDAGLSSTKGPVSELLKRSMSLRMPRDTLEAALAQLGRDMGVEIVIRGPDLQLDGITKNQSLAIDVENQSAESILVEILRRANPDKSATDAHDPRQKLVYVTGPKGPGGPEVIFITTRARAAERGDKLPAAFEAGK